MGILLLLKRIEWLKKKKENLYIKLNVLEISN